MPTITLSDLYDAKLKALVTEPFVDTRESIVQRLIDEEHARLGLGNSRARTAGDNHRRLNPDSPDSLTHAKVLSATIDGRELNRPKWTSIMDQLHVLGHQRLGSFDALKRASGANLCQGRFEMHGYKYLPEADLSIQGVSAALAWERSLRLARELRVPIRLIVKWLDKDGAAYPGQTAVLEWSPSR